MDGHSGFFQKFSFQSVCNAFARLNSASRELGKSKIASGFPGKQHKIVPDKNAIYPDVETQNQVLQR